MISSNPYRKAGRIAAEVRNYASSFVQVGMPLLQICETLEKEVEKKGGKLAFPCNICINDVAAHYSSPPNDSKIVPEGSIVKVDLGVHVDGYIADTATTISFDPEYDAMVYAVEEALNEAIKHIRPGIRSSDVGKAIQSTIERNGYKPIWNLSGHQVSRYALHTGKSIPNVSNFSLTGGEVINDGEVYAVEPFLTLPSGKGKVTHINNAYIYRYQKDKSIQDEQALRLLRMIKLNFRTLPFCQRWIKGFSREELALAFQELLANKCLSAYPVLVEGLGKVVAQAEHTIIVTKEGCFVTTL